MAILGDFAENQNLREAICSKRVVMLALAMGCPKLEHFDTHIGCTSITDRGIRTMKGQDHVEYPIFH